MEHLFLEVQLCIKISCFLINFGNFRISCQIAIKRPAKITQLVNQVQNSGTAPGRMKNGACFKRDVVLLRCKRSSMSLRYYAVVMFQNSLEQVSEAEEQATESVSDDSETNNS